MPEYPPLSDLFAQLQAWTRVNAPMVKFNPPANPAALDNFTEKSGLVLPEELREILLLADGETRQSAGAIGNWRLLPINEIQAAWGLLKQLDAKGAFADLTPESSPYIRKAWWHSGWIPMVSSDLGDYICVDTSPPEPARFGQVLLFLHERPERSLIAAGLTAWLDCLNRDLAAGVYAYDPVEGFNGEAFLWSALEGKHLFEDIPGRRVV